MCVAQRHLYRAVTQEIAHGVQRDAVLDEIGREVMAQIVPAKVGDPGALEQLSPALFKSRHYIKDAGAGAGLLLPLPQCVDRFLIQRHVTGLAALRSRTLNGEQSAVEVYRFPTQLEEFTASKSGVHGE